MADESYMSVGLNKTYCCVPQCSNGAWKNPHLSFHCFPRVKESWPRFKQEFESRKRNQWIAALRIGKNVTDRMVVCSDHFKISDFQIPVLSRRCLKRNAVPSLKLPVTLDENKEEQQKTIPVADKVVKSSVKNKTPPQKNHRNNGNILYYKLSIKNTGDLSKKQSEKINQENYTPPKSDADCSKNVSADSYTKDTNHLLVDAVPTIFDLLVDTKQQTPAKRKVMDDDIVTSEDTTELNPESLDSEAHTENSSAAIDNILLNSEKNQTNTSMHYKKNEVQTDDETTDSETDTCSEELNYFSDSESSKLQQLQQKLDSMTGLYKRTKKKLKQCQQKCSLYEKEINSLKEVIYSLRAINAVQEDS